MNKLFLFLWIPATLIGACKNGREPRRGNPAAVRKPFRLPDIPSAIPTDSLRKAYLAENFWQHYDFGDTAVLRVPEITDQLFSVFAHLLPQVPESAACQGIHHMIRSAGNNSRMCIAFMELCRKYFYDPNAPTRNDRFYARALDEALNWGKMETEECLRLRNLLLLVQKNQPGTVASDFTFTLANGDQKRMRAIQSPLLLIYFNNPGCGGCHQVQRFLEKSDVIDYCLSQGELTILSVYPDQDLTAWKANLGKMPPSWINAYDGHTVIRGRRLYDLKAIPALYLLDENKTVILKDASVEAIEDYLIVHTEKR